jgi:hypothetical protein
MVQSWRACGNDAVSLLRANGLIVTSYTCHPAHVSAMERAPPVARHCTTLRSDAIRETDCDAVTFLCFRLAPQLMASPPQLSVAPANTIAMPVFPLRSAPSPYSPYSPSRFHIDKRCQHRCSWKCCSIALILLSVALTAMLAYFGGEYSDVSYLTLGSTQSLTEMSTKNLPGEQSAAGA